MHKVARLPITHNASRKTKRTPNHDTTENVVSHTAQKLKETNHTETAFVVPTNYYSLRSVLSHCRSLRRARFACWSLYQSCVLPTETAQVLAVALHFACPTSVHTSSYDITSCDTLSARVTFHRTRQCFPIFVGPDVSSEVMI